MNKSRRDPGRYKHSFKSNKLFVELLFELYLDFRCNSKIIEASCEMRPEFSDWTCCESHKNLSRIYNSLQKLAKTLDQPPSKADVLSETWWNQLGYEFPKEFSQK